MPAYGTFPSQPVTEIDAMQPAVTIGASLYDYCTCLAIEKNTGIVPSKAFIKLAGNNYEVNGNITLNAYNLAEIVHGARVRIDNGAEPLFLGQLIRRRDQGQGNAIIWEAWDDRWLLSKIPVRGCLVWDPVDLRVKFISSFVARVNPLGRRNCIGAAIAGIDGTVPVFSALPEQQGGYDDSDTDNTLSSGALSAWTPSKWIKYLCALSNIAAAGVDGANVGSWRSLSSSKRLGWKYMDCSFPSDPGQSMDRKIPDRIFQGQTILHSLNEALQAAGSYGTTIGYDNDSSGKLKSFVKFFPRDKSKRGTGGSAGTNPPRNNIIYLQRGGDAADIRTAFDFELDEDASEVCESALVDGAQICVEAQLQYANSASWQTSPASSDVLQPSWTQDDFIAFGNIVMGTGPGAPASPSYARYPLRQPDVTRNETWSSVKWTDANGTGANPLAHIKSKEAVQLARQILPRVLRAFEVNSRNAASILAGHNGVFSDTTKYPYLKTPRPILPEQLQYYLDQNTRKTRVPFPIRIQIATHGSGAWHDVTSNHGLRVTHDGLIWLDGLTDDLDGADAIYTGQLSLGPYAGSSPPPIAIRDIRINAAVPADLRKSAISDDSSGRLDPSLATDLGGGMLLYIDSPDGFHEDHQVNSYPSAVGSFVGTISQSGSPVAISTPLNRVLFDDSTRIATHAQRRIRDKKWIRRASSWKLIGIRPDYDAGMYIDTIKVSGQSGDRDYTIQAPVESVTYDFVNQVTLVGGLFSQCTDNAD